MAAVVVASDTLTTSAGTMNGRTADVGGNWAERFNDSTTNGEVDGVTSSGRAAAVSNSAAMVYTVGTPTTPDYEVDLELQVPHANALDNGNGIVGRYISEQDHYGIDAGTVGQLYKVVGGVNTSLGSTWVIAVGDKVRLKMVGTTISAWLDTGAGFVQQTSVTDSSHTAKGKGGIWWGNIRFGTQDVDPEAQDINFIVSQDGALLPDFRPVVMVVT